MTAKTTSVEVTAALETMDEIRLLANNLDKLAQKGKRQLARFDADLESDFAQISHFAVQIITGAEWVQDQYER